MSDGKRKSNPEGGDGAPKPKKPSKTEDKENKLLGNMLQHLMIGTESVSFKSSGSDLDFMVRTKTWVEAWKELIEKGFIEPCESGAPVTTGEFRLTEAGKSHAATDEYKEYVKDMNFVAATNEDHHARIKKKLKYGDRGCRIFDLLLEHGSLNRKELALIIGVVSGTHSFSYGLKELKDKEYVEVDSSCSSRGDQKLHLTDKAFLPGQRPASERTDPKVLAKLIGDAEKAKTAKKESSAKKVKKTKKAVKPDADKKETHEEAKTVTSSSKEGHEIED